MKRLTFLVFSFALLTFFPFSLAAQDENVKITLEDIFKNRKFSSRGAGTFTSMNDGDHYCQLKKDSINIYEYETGKYSGTVVLASDLIPAGDTVPIEMGSFTFSDDESKILFATGEEPIYRRSSKANYYIYDIRKKTLIPLSANGKQRLATFSPDGTKVAFVRDNNIFYVDLGQTAEKSGHPALKEIAITTDGIINEVINGATDWVYEEEFEFSQAFFWSPDSKKIAFYRFDETKVKEYQLTYYGDLYPEQYKYKYPKAGEDNSLISIHLYDLTDQRLIKADIGEETNIYIPRMKWTTDPTTLAIYRMNRHQNKLELLLADASTGNSKVIYTEENRYYIEINDHWTFLKNGKELILTSEKDGFRHIYMYTLTGKEVRQITSGKWEVADILGVDEKTGRIFYSSYEDSPLYKSVYRIALDGSGKQRLPSPPGAHTAEFSRNGKWYLSRWSDINTPPRSVICNSDDKEVRLIQDNAKLKETIAKYGYSKAEFFTCTARDGWVLNGAMIKPPDFDPTKKYPVLFTIYGGPGSQTVLNSWGSFSAWNQFWAQQGIVVVSVDNRGTGGRGEEFKKCTYLQLGKYETMDQVDAAKYLASLPYVDKSRIGMWGWSFGGYLTLSCLTRGADIFSFGIAVAPVTNWKYYDNIYTERFMRTPAENNEGYESNSPVNHASEFKGKLLMIHGMADDNVHPQNAYDMFTALVAAGKEFDSEFYPNSNHGIYTGKNTTFHLYKRMTDFILKNLN